MKTYTVCSKPNVTVYCLTGQHSCWLLFGYLPVLCVYPVQLTMQRYAFHMIFACVMGLCHSDDDSPQCICKPTMKLDFDTSSSHIPICNNATYDWLLNVALAEVTKQRERADAEATEAETLRQQLYQKERAVTELGTQLGDVTEQLRLLQEEHNTLLDKVDAEATATALPRDCADIQKQGFHYSGIYTIYPSHYGNQAGHTRVDTEDRPGHESASTETGEGLEVFCDLNTSGGGWLVFQRRQDGSQPFDKDWRQYKAGFGRIAKEFWLGNDNLYVILSQGLYELRVDITDYKGDTYFATYSTFMLGDEESMYTLTVDGYGGNAGDAMSHHNHSPFSTSDRDHDKSRSGNCSQLFGGGGWWFVRCYDANLNGRYGSGHGNGLLVWYQLHHDHESMKHVEMKIRPVNFNPKER